MEYLTLDKHFLSFSQDIASPHTAHMSFLSPLVTAFILDARWAISLYNHFLESGLMPISGKKSHSTNPGVKSKTLLSGKGEVREASLS